MNNLNLMTIMRNDPDFGKRFAKKVEEVKQDKQNLLSIAHKYERKYEREVAEGDRLKQKLLTEGSRQGLSEAEVMGQYGKYVPCRQTPVLNFLYFLLRESSDDPYYGSNLYKKRDAINEYLVKIKQVNHEDSSDMSENEAETLLNNFLTGVFEPSTEQRKEINSQFEDELNNRLPEDEVSMKSPETMVEYIYGNLTLEQFTVLKKLKSLTLSDNVAEASLAWKKGRELCVKFNLEWERIPNYYQKKK
jgi:hypothetical protein